MEGKFFTACTRFSLTPQKTMGSEACQLQLDIHSTLLIFARVSNELTFICSAHTKQKKTKKTTHTQECSQLCFYAHCLVVSVVPLCLLIPPQITLFFFPPGGAQRRMVAAPESKQGQGLSRRARSLSRPPAVMAEPVTLSCVVVK